MTLRTQFTASEQDVAELVASIKDLFRQGYALVEVGLHTTEPDFDTGEVRQMQRKLTFCEHTLPATKVGDVIQMPQKAIVLRVEMHIRNKEVSFQEYGLPSQPNDNWQELLTVEGLADWSQTKKPVAQFTIHKIELLYLAGEVKL